AFVSDDNRGRLQNDRAFCGIASQSFDWEKLVGSAKTLALLTRPAFLRKLKKRLEALKPIKEAVPGVTGDILYKKETPHGLILFGGKGANRYELKTPVAFLADLGGDDVYKGVVASSFDADHPNSVVIDFAGDDTYEGD